jgi:V-ATPase subunit C.
MLFIFLRGNLNTKDLSDILKKPVVDDRDFVYTEYLTTAIAVVPK